jgi:hypothetical protein
MNLQTDFHRGCTSLHSHQHWDSFLPPTPLAFVVCFLYDSHSDCGENVILIYISFMAKAVEHFFMYLLVICTSSEKGLFNSLAHLLIGLSICSFGV